MPARLSARMVSCLDATLAALGDGFLRVVTHVERSYTRPFSRLSVWLRFAFPPLLAIGAIARLACDRSHGRSSNSAENAILDRVVKTHPALDARLDRIDRHGFAGLEAYFTRE